MESEDQIVAAPDPTVAAPDPTVAAPDPTVTAPDPTVAALDSTAAALEPTVADLDDDDSFFSQMMSSQGDVEDSVEKLKALLDDESRSVEDKIDALQEVITMEKLQNCSVDMLDTKIFSVALSSVRQLYFQIMAEINAILKTVESQNASEVKEKLSTCVTVLKCWSPCIEHVKILEKCSLSIIKSLPETLMDVASDVISHCKNSENTYGIIFKLVGEELTTLFRQCNAVLNSFFSILDKGNIVDSNSTNDDVAILIKAIDGIGTIALLTSGMDAKSLTDSWKMFGKLATIYQLQIKQHSPDTITAHYKDLAANITAIISTAIQIEQLQIKEREVICGRVLLKIFEKLCETYCGWIRNDVMYCITEMLCKLYRCTRYCTSAFGFDPNAAKFVETNLTLVIEPFVAVIFRNENFRKAFFEYEKKNDGNVAGFHILTLTIMHMISQGTSEAQSEWISQEYSIINSAFENIDRVREEICTSKLQIKIFRNNQEGPYLATFYEATCLMIFSIVCRVSSTEFKDIENLLLKSLLSGKLFSALLSSDVWCFICRIGSSQLNIDHLKYLLKAHHLISERSTSFHVLILSSLIKRLYSFLSDKNKDDLLEDFKGVTDPYFWQPIGTMMAPASKLSFQQRLKATNVNLTDRLKNVQEQPSVKNWSLLMGDLELVAVTGLDLDKTTIDVLAKMWTSIVNSMEDCEDVNLTILEDLVTKLFYATRIQCADEQSQCLILKSILSLHPYASSRLRLEMCYFLKRLVVEVKDCSLATSNLIAELFSQLFIDKAPWVKEEAFETFVFFAQKCTDADLVSNVAGFMRNIKSEVTKTLPAYISGTPYHKLSGYSNIDLFFETFAKRVASDGEGHVCYPKNDRERNEKLPRMDKCETESTDNNIAKAEAIKIRVQNACEELRELLLLRNEMSQETFGMLRDTCSEVVRDRNELN